MRSRATGTHCVRTHVNVTAKWNCVTLPISRFVRLRSEGRKGRSRAATRTVFGSTCFRSTRTVTSRWTGSPKRTTFGDMYA